MIHVLQVFDNNYVGHAASSLLSIRKHTQARLHVHVVYCDLTDANIKKYRDFVACNEMACSFYPVDVTPYKANLPVSGHFTISAYLKIFAVDVLEIDECLYVDPDVFFRDDIRSLFEKNRPAEWLLLAVEDYIPEKAGIDFTERDAYFNSGVMLMNITELKKFGLVAHSLDAMSRGYQFPYVDNDVLNIVLKDKWSQMDFAWNFRYQAERILDKLLMTKREEYFAAKTSPAAIHYVGPDKPWFYRTMLPFKEIYWDCLKETPWADYVPPDKKPSVALWKVMEATGVNAAFRKWKAFRRQLIGNELRHKLKALEKRIKGQKTN